MKIEYIETNEEEKEDGVIIHSEAYNNDIDDVADNGLEEDNSIIGDDKFGYYN